jgi:hypothetical protein
MTGHNSERRKNEAARVVAGGLPLGGGFDWRGDCGHGGPGAASDPGSIGSRTAPAGNTRRAGPPSTLGQAVRDFKLRWEELATTPLTTIERNRLKASLIQEWRSGDPGGFLAFLELKNSWPDQMSADLFDNEPVPLDPVRLLEFSRRWGYDEAHYGIGPGDPNEWKRLILALPETDRGESWQSTLAEIEAQPFEDRAHQLYREGRLEEFGVALEQVALPDGRERIVKEIAESMQREKLDERVVAKLLELPENLRESVASSLFWGLGPSGLSSVPAREDRRNLALKLAQAGLSKSAEEAIMHMTGSRSILFDQKQNHRENEAWFRTLPDQPELDSIRRAIFKVWAQNDPEAALAAVPTLPAGYARDIAAAAVVERGPAYGASEEQQIKLRALIDLIKDPELRKESDRKFAVESTGGPRLFSE